MFGTPPPPKPDPITAPHADVDLAQRYQGANLQRYRENLRKIQKRLQQRVKINLPALEIGAFYQKLHEPENLPPLRSFTPHPPFALPDPVEEAAARNLQTALQNMETAHAKLYTDLQAKWEKELKPLQDDLAKFTDTDAKMKKIRKLFLEHRAELRDIQKTIKHEVDEFYQKDQTRQWLKDAYSGQVPPLDNGQLDQMLNAQKEAFKEKQKEQDDALQKAYNEAYKLQSKITAMAESESAAVEMEINLDAAAERKFDVVMEGVVLEERNRYVTNNGTYMFVNNGVISSTHRSLGVMDSLFSADYPGYKLNGEPNRMMQDIRQQLLLAKAMKSKSVTLDASYITLGNMASASSYDTTPERTHDEKTTRLMAIEARLMGFAADQIFVRDAHGQKVAWSPTPQEQFMLNNRLREMEEKSNSKFEKTGKQFDVLRTIFTTDEELTTDIAAIVVPSPPAPALTLAQANSLVAQNNNFNKKMELQLTTLNELYDSYPEGSPEKTAVKTRIEEYISRIDAHLHKQETFHQNLDDQLDFNINDLALRLTPDPAAPPRLPAAIALDEGNYKKWNAVRESCEQSKKQCQTSERKLNSLRATIGITVPAPLAGFNPR